MTNRATRYPHHLAKNVAIHLQNGNGHGNGHCDTPSLDVLSSLFETLYFASLKTDEGRPCRFTINYLDPRALAHRATANGDANHWDCVRFERPLPFAVRTLAKLAEAADPTCSSLAVFSDESGQLFVWGLIDQELRYADYAALDSTNVPERPGLFQATINGVGNVSVYKNYSLICSLEQNTLVEQYHNVIWSGPVHELLKAQLWPTIAQFAEGDTRWIAAQKSEVGNEFMIRWLNAVCRILMNIQQYRHGGGLLITPEPEPTNVQVKYKLHYDRLPQALVAMVQHQLTKNSLAGEVNDHCVNPQQDYLPCQLHENLVTHRRQLEMRKNEALGCVRFIASLSRVDGFVMLDRSLVVHGFGVELRADSSLSDIWLAGDTRAQPRLMRTTHLEEYGTRHRAMMRYCYETPGTLGFVVSQDSDIRAMMRIGDKLVLWENINVQLAFKLENHVSEPHLALFPTLPILNAFAHPQ